MTDYLTSGFWFAPMLIHTLFDLLAAASALTMTFTVYRWRLAEAAQRIESAGLVMRWRW